MPTQFPAPKRARPIPFDGSMGRAFPRVPLPVKARTRPETPAATSAQAGADTRVSADAQARADRVTRYYFYAFMALDVLGLAAVGYAIMTM